MDNHGERLAALEERVRGVDRKVDAVIGVVKSIASDVTDIKIRQAEKRGSSKTLNYISHLVVGVGGVLATLLTIKH